MKKFLEVIYRGQPISRGLDFSAQMPDPSVVFPISHGHLGNSASPSSNDTISLASQNRVCHSHIARSIKLLFNEAMKDLRLQCVSASTLDLEIENSILEKEMPDQWMSQGILHRGQAIGI